MRNNHSLMHFFWIYFGSVAILILGAGYLYFYEQKGVLISAEHDSILHYAKMQQYTDDQYIDPLYSFERRKEYKPWYEQDTMHQENGFFYYRAPTDIPNEFLFIRKSAEVYEKAREGVLIKIILTEVVLLTLFSVISWFLARESIRPLKSMIRNLDDFVKNLVHDLNTPATAILLNAKLLRTKGGENDTKRIERIESSTQEILSLYNNLSILLKEHKLEVVDQDIVPIVINSAEHFQELYPAIEFKVELPESSLFKLDRQAFEQILNNLLSNACKYSSPNRPTVTVRLEGRDLYIKDNGIGMESPQKVFERLYSEHTQGHGIGMHIVQRLSQLLDIQIRFDSQKGVGTQVCLSFKRK